MQHNNTKLTLNTTNKGRNNKKNQKTQTKSRKYWLYSPKHYWKENKPPKY